MRERDKEGEFAYVRSRWSHPDNCVIVARRADGQVAIGNSRDVGTPPLIFANAEWVAFLNGVRTGDFDAV